MLGVAPERPRRGGLMITGPCVQMCMLGTPWLDAVNESPMESRKCLRIKRRRDRGDGRRRVNCFVLLSIYLLFNVLGIGIGVSLFRCSRWREDTCDVFGSGIVCRQEDLVRSLPGSEDLLHEFDKQSVPYWHGDPSIYGWMMSLE